MDKTTCAFTGHRPHKFRWRSDEVDPRCVALKAVLAEQVGKLVAAGVTDYYSGMADGSDVWLSQIVLDLRKENPALKLHCFLPCEGQSDKWSSSAQERYHSILGQADSVEYVSQIPPRERNPATLRVAAYCRVSSDSSDQLHSYAAQIRNYTDEISRHDGWELVDIYADEGLTGTRMDQREDFNRMLSDCRKGKIDKVLVKSLSRFSRNSKDCLATLRELTSLGVSVYFEKENINTETLTTELMVSVSSAMAQQESISIAENQRISYQRRMERGEFITCKAPFGYQLKDGKNLEIVPKEAEQVRWIFDSYLSGRSLAWIAEQMTKKGFRTTDGRPYWQETTVHYLLSNEKYVGDSLCQKTFTLGFPFVGKRNHGERDQYYTEHSHPAIISKEMFDITPELEHRKSGYVERKRRPYQGNVVRIA